MTQPQTPATARPQPPKFRLILFVAGDEHNSRIAKENLALICRDILDSRCEAQIVDVLQDFAAAVKYNILLTPSLLVVEPPPELLIIGNLNDLEEVRAALQAGNGRI